MFRLNLKPLTFSRSHCHLIVFDCLCAPCVHSRCTMCAPMLSLWGHVEAGDNAAPQDTSAASYYCVVHTQSDDTSSIISCSSRLSQVTQCTPTSGHALLTMVHLKALSPVTQALFDKLLKMFKPLKMKIFNGFNFLICLIIKF